ncbi:hypothetical protein CI102_14727 [Trichoderma harzianum]|nr:hypothetical protein CI102_14727 [Trichoderma harzianum]
MWISKGEMPRGRLRTGMPSLWPIRSVYKGSISETRRREILRTIAGTNMCCPTVVFSFSFCFFCLLVFAHIAMLLPLFPTPHLVQFPSPVSVIQSRLSRPPDKCWPTDTEPGAMGPVLDLFASA